MSKTIDPLFFAEVFVDVITSGNNKNIIFLIEAKPGQGKSWTALRLAVDCSVGLSKKLGGIPTDYFNIDHMGIIMPDKMVEVIENMGKYNVVILDDVGMAYSGRKWQSAGNEAMNNMLQTMRTMNNIIIMTVPDSDWIDKIGRTILHFKMVMETPLHSLGYSLGRLTEEKKMYNSTSKKILHPYLKQPDTIYNKCLIGRPPKALSDEYEHRREIQLNRLREESVISLKTQILEDATGDTDKRQTKETIMNNLSQKTLDYIEEVGSKQKAFEMARTELNDTLDFKCSYRTLQRWWKENNVNTHINTT